MPGDVLTTNTGELAETDPGFLIEERQINETRYKVLLFGHIGKNAPVMESTLNDCDYVAWEQPGHNNGHKRRDEDTASKADKELSESLGRMLKGRQRGILLDIHQDHPDYPKVEVMKESLGLYIESIIIHDPVAITRSKLLQAVTKTAVSYSIRDNIIRDQLLALPPKLGDAEVGVAIGSMHYRVLDGLGEGGIDAVREKVYRGLKPFDKLVETVRENRELDDAMINDALLQTYLLCYGIDLPPAAAYEGYTLNPKITARLLEWINETASSDESLEEKDATLEPYLRAVAELAAEQDE